MIAIIFSVFLIATLVLARFLYKSWLYPISLQYFMNSQGIKGPRYEFRNGNCRATLEMQLKCNNAPMDISHDIFPRLQPHFHSWIKLYGSTFLYWVNSSQPQLIVSDVELIKDIFTNKQGTFGKAKFDGILKKFVGDGSVFQEGHKWLKLRKVADNVFHAQSLKDMLPAMVGRVEAMLKTWKSYEGKELEVFEEFRLLSLEIISNSVFGSDYSTGKHIFTMLDNIAYISSMSYGKNQNPIIDKFFRSSDEIEADKILEELSDSFAGIIKKREDRVKARQSDNFGDDFLGSLLEGRFNADQIARISVDEIIEECKSFYFAGHKTVTSLLSWSVLLLAINPDWQEKAREEVFETVGQENPKAESISRLKIVGMIINEALRLYPPFLLLQRDVTKNTRLGKLRIPAGIEVIIATLAVHHNSEVWGEEAHLFKPERFADGVSKAARDQVMAFLSFGYGLRKCVGYNFATMEVKIALSMILRRYRLTVSPNYNHYPIPMFTLRPKDGIQIILHPL
ncbi:cytochrome P450 CYP749A22-like [Lycium barbarum]|uniref:cytochrome P450 CYP749A22-like n=1 Tax=Lycium barbarum TaxID=112863 RepID=UPI00293E4984|nr:cytochrome P450 CYP749A22-like [Lycium barbarum]